MPDREAKVVAGSPDLFQMIESGRGPVPFESESPTREGRFGAKEEVIVEVRLATAALSQTWPDKAGEDTSEESHTTWKISRIIWTGK